jgi:hypothetical protein
MLGSDAERYYAEARESGHLRVAVAVRLDYLPWSGQSTGKFSWGSYLVFVDVCEDSGETDVYGAQYQENLYR